MDLDVEAGSYNGQAIPGLSVVQDRGELLGGLSGVGVFSASKEGA
jgi:hypothetical protein